MVRISALCRTQILIALLVSFAPLLAMPAHADDSARMKQLRLLCVQLSGDLTDPGGMAAFRRCLSTHDPIGEIKRDNGLDGRRGGGRIAILDRPNAAPPKGFGRDSRNQLGQSAYSIATLDGKTGYVIGGDGKAYRFAIGGKGVQEVAPSAVVVRLAGDGHLFVIDKDGVLWRANADGSGRAAIDHAVKDVEPAGGVVYVRDADGALWRENPDGSGRAPVDQGVVAFQPLDAHVVLVLGSNGKLWRETGDMHSRALVASNIHAFQYVPNGDTTYVTTASNDLWRQSGKDKAEHVDKDVVAFHAADMNLVYVLARDGRLWQELGDRSQAVLVDTNVLIGAGEPTFEVLDAHHLYILDSDHKLWGETMPPGR